MNRRFENIPGVFYPAARRWENLPGVTYPQPVKKEPAPVKAPAPIRPSDEEILATYLRLDRSVDRTRDHLHLGWHTVKRVVTAAGYHERWKRSRDKSLDARVVRSYLKVRSISSVAKLYGIGVGRVIRILDDAGVERNGPGRPNTEEARAA